MRAFWKDVASKVVSKAPGAAAGQPAAEPVPTPSAAPAPPATAELQDLDIRPRNVEMTVGGKQQFTATAMYADGTKRDVTKDIVWTSTSAEDVSIDENGLATAHRAQGVQIRAREPQTDWRSTAMVEVAGDKSQVLLWLKVSPEEATIEGGNRQQFTATGGYADKSKKDLTKQVTWSSSDESVLSVDAAGLAISHSAVGRTRITATLPDNKDYSDFAKVTVTVNGKRPPKPPKLTAIAITPAQASIASGAKQQFTATGVYADGSEKDLTKLVAWKSDDDAILLIDRHSGVATAQRGQGSTRIQAVDPESALYQGIDVTVTADSQPPTQARATSPGADGGTTAPKEPKVTGTAEAPKDQSKTGLINPFAEDELSSLKSVTLGPERVAIPIGKKQQLIATGEYADG